jgi:DNA-binding NtrC family response regulator
MKEILVVDDNENTLNIIERYLTSEKALVHVATNVPDAMRLINEKNLDLVLTDLRMPKYNGIYLTRYIVNYSDGVKVVVMSGDLDNESVSSLIKLGVRHILSKPFRCDELKMILNDIFSAPKVLCRSENVLRVKFERS